MAILLLTGFFNNLVYGHMFVTVVIGAIYFLGCFGLYIIGNNEKRSHVILMAYIGVLIAWFTLEALFREMYGG